MIPKAEFFEWIENYFEDQLSEVDRKEFESELKHNGDLREELKLHQEIKSAVSEKDIVNLRDKLQNISKTQKSEKNSLGAFELLDEFADIEEINENVSPEELINFYDSLPKVHVYQHEMSSKENVHEFYREQEKSNLNGEMDDSLEGFDFEELEDLEGLEEAVLEKDIINLRETLSQVAKSVKPQYSTEDIDSYLSGELSGEKLHEFETELEQNRALREEVQLHREMESALLEGDILELRNQLSHILETETSWNVSEKDIESYIDGELEGELLDEFLAELTENTDLMSEVNLRRNVNEAASEKDIFDLREELAEARRNAENTEVKSIIPDSKIKLAKNLKRYAAVIILLLGISGVLNISFNSLDKTYNSYYKSPQWSPERSLTYEATRANHYFTEGNLYFMNGDYQMAIQNYNKALEKENEKYASHFYKGASLQNLNQFKEAIPEYNQVIKHADNLFIEEAEWNRALCNIKLGELDKAKVQLTAIIDKNSFYKKDAKAILRRLKYSIK
ncbi:tetratricopeptide repeat protein [Maribellus maritimus]|uniref:tetratricopeptide repeat protein n=1 Tax=Maribellus maritimus TaxID=2870838 RepID=UPI001EEBE4C3|nr:tetratricopeptide repeat protein [Maribellus maritimus]MCG6189402.1 hypothetical protein [Maribellus maritimus]